MTQHTTLSELVPKDADRDFSQIERKNLAKGAWAEGRPEDALLILEEVLREEMSPAVAAECYTAQAAFLAEMGNIIGSLGSLNKAAPFLDAADPYVQGCFFNQRARAYKELKDHDAALMDYAGAAALFEQAGRTDHSAIVAKNLAGLCLELPDTSAALEAIDRALTMFGKVRSIHHGHAYDTKARILLSQGKLESALVEINRAISMAGDNPSWLASFEQTKKEIREKLISVLLPYVNAPDLWEIELAMLKQALIDCDGSVTRAAERMGITHKAVSSLVKNHPEFSHLRKPQRVRRKSLPKK